MRREAEYFGDLELCLVYVARKLEEAQKLEAVLTAAGMDYYVTPEEYMGGFLFPTRRIGAFFYVRPQEEQYARQALRGAGYRPWDE